MKIIIWTASEAYYCESDNSVSSFSLPFATEKEAKRKMTDWIRERVQDYYDGREDWTVDEVEGIVTKLVGKSKESWNGGIFTDWENGNEHFSWSVNSREIEVK